MAGRLDLSLENEEPELESALCPIDRVYMTDAAMTEDGFTFQKDAIERWFAQVHKVQAEELARDGEIKTQLTNPINRHVYESEVLTDNWVVKQIIEEFNSKHKPEIVRLRKDVKRLEDELKYEQAQKARFYRIATNFRDKYAAVRTDIAKLEAENKKLCAQVREPSVQELATRDKEISRLQAALKAQEAENLKMKEAQLALRCDYLGVSGQHLKVIAELQRKDIALAAERKANEQLKEELNTVQKRTEDKAKLCFELITCHYSKTLRSLREQEARLSAQVSTPPSSSYGSFRQTLIPPPVVSVVRESEARAVPVAAL